MNGDIMSARIARMVANVGGEPLFNYTIHIDPDLRFIFFSNPICACSTLKATLNVATARALGIPFAINSAAMIHDRASNILKTPRQVGLNVLESLLDDPGVKKIAFIRSPESRFLSAFRKKLTYESVFSKRVRTHLGVASDMPLRDFLTLDSFAKQVANDQTLRDLDEHWRLQRKQIFFDEVSDLDIGFVENFSADTSRLLGEIFGADGYQIQDAVALNPSNASGNRKRGGELSDAARGYIADAYAADYDMINLCRKRKAYSM